jgi:hypothetical protein
MGVNTGQVITAEEGLSLMSQIAQEFVEEIKNQ